MFQSVPTAPGELQISEKMANAITGWLLAFYQRPACASMVVEQAVEPPMGKTENPAATVRRRLAEQGRPLMYPKRRTKLELEEMAGTAVAVAVGPEDCLHLRRLMARQNYRPVSGSRRTADRRGKGLLVQMAGRAV